MSKSKTKTARRQLKRDGQRKIAEFHKKEAKAALAVAATVPKPANPRSTLPASQPVLKKLKASTTAAKGSTTATKGSTTATKGSTTATKAETQAPKPVQASQKHEVPFGAYDHILLVGEGDFSFTQSLVQDHGCANVTATSYDTADEVLAKYPAFEDTRRALAGLTPPVPIHHGVDAAKLSSDKTLKCARDDEADDDSSPVSGWDKIVFMFPHVGGLSTHLNRQVRSNQALLVDFFKSCLETSTSKQRLRILEQQSNRPNLVQRAPTEFLKTGGHVMVALFEGDPYSLWNIRDLARHAGLKVVESWRFDWTQYPSYAHVRTLGALEGGGAWKGEDREARMYVFEKIRLEADSDEERALEKRGVKLGKKRVVKVQRKRKAVDDDSD